MYIISKNFIKGILKGLTITKKTNVKYEIGKTYNNYIITNIIEV